MSALVDLQVFTTFKRHNTIYFWSLLVTSWGIMSHSLGIILKWFVGSCPWYVNTAFASFGWWGMVTGQSLVLYSRLHLVIRSPKILRSVLIMIIFNFCIFQIPTTILTFGSNQADPGMWLKVYNVYERIQLIVFTLQELTISVLYIRAASKMLLPDDLSETRVTKKLLIYLNLLCIVLDIAFVCEVYSGEWVYKTGTQSLAYAIKLTVEFVVLNKLMEMYRLRPRVCAACTHGFGKSRPDRSANVQVPNFGYRSRTRPSMVRQGNSFPGSSALWLQGKTRGIQRLGPVGEEMVEHAAHKSHGQTYANAEVGAPTEIADPAKDIIVTTGFSTWRESRSSPVSPISASAGAKA
ncbi:MAG: hypothetical protein Q9196_002609 [Gyalolechia fulgens]